MKFLRFSAAACALALSLSACATSAPSPDPAHNSQNALDWAGIYRGVLPCADCPGIETVVTLESDGRFVRQTRYLEKGDREFRTEGRFRWNAAGSEITLEGDEPLRYRVGENHLEQLALDGSRITGPLAAHYVLRKAEAAPEASLRETYWKLVELNGQPVETLKREPHLILKAEGARVTGYGGCNGFGGGYELDEAKQRIRFVGLASTLMACAEGMDTERAFHDALSQADNYSLNGDHLTLNKARMAPLARFEAVYLK